MNQRKPANPSARMGVYKRIEDVPAEHHLSRYTQYYDGRDIWAKWAEEALTMHTSNRYAMYVERTERSWKEHMATCGRHHALATPDDVETWSVKILQRCQPLSAYQIYFTKLEAFYTWLQFHTNHPHSYQPVWIAARDGEATARIWRAKIERREQ